MNRYQPAHRKCEIVRGLHAVRAPGNPGKPQLHRSASDRCQGDKVRRRRAVLPDQPRQETLRRGTEAVLDHVLEIVPLPQVRRHPEARRAIDHEFAVHHRGAPVGIGAHADEMDRDRPPDPSPWRVWQFEYEVLAAQAFPAEVPGHRGLVGWNGEPGEVRIADLVARILHGQPRIAAVAPVGVRGTEA